MSPVTAGLYIRANGRTGRARGCGGVEIVPTNAGSRSESIRTVDPGGVNISTDLAGGWIGYAIIVISSHAAQGIVGGITIEIAAIIDGAVDASANINKEILITAQDNQGTTIVLACLPCRIVIATIRTTI